jgi:membrane-bound serine protease (ClpP class)
MAVFWKRLIQLLMLYLLLAWPIPVRSEPVDAVVYIIPVHGTVDPGMAIFIKRCVEKHRQEPGASFVLELDTFGGRVDSALEIVDTMLEIPGERTVAFVTKKAISAGTLIALSCGRLFMKPGTTIGDCAPITYSQEGPQVLGEKFQSPIRAKFRSLARRNGYPEALAEAMVTAEMTVFEVVMDGSVRYMDQQAYDDLTEAEKQRVSTKKTVVAQGELLTMDATEAVELGFSGKTVESVDKLLEEAQLSDARVVAIEETWSESMVRFIGAIAPILLMIGLAALYAELQSPGFGVPGVVGLICLAVIFLNQYMVGLADYTELLIIVLGVVLLGIEMVVLPGFGIAGFAGIACILAGIVLSLQDFVVPDPSLPWQSKLLIQNIGKALGALLAGFLLAMMLLRYVFPGMFRSAEGPYLKTTLRDSRADSGETKRVQVGDTGISLSFLRPSGKARFGDSVVDVISEGEYLEKGSEIVVSRIQGNRVIVSRKTGVV